MIVFFADEILKKTGKTARRRLRVERETESEEAKQLAVRPMFLALVYFAQIQGKKFHCPPYRKRNLANAETHARDCFFVVCTKAATRSLSISF